jgi:hypothetical protein
MVRHPRKASAIHLMAFRSLSAENHLGRFVQTFSQNLDPDVAEQEGAVPVPKPARAANWLNSIQSLNIAANRTVEAQPERPMAVPEALAAVEGEVIPEVPNTIEATGLSEAAVEHLLLKIIYFRGERTGRQLAIATGLRWSIIEPILENLKRFRRSFCCRIPAGPLRATICSPMHTPGALRCRWNSTPRWYAARSSRTIGSPVKA